jgi:hypothetical protein
MLISTAVRPIGFTQRQQRPDLGPFPAIVELRSNLQATFRAPGATTPRVALRPADRFSGSTHGLVGTEVKGIVAITSVPTPTV